MNKKLLIIVGLIVVTGLLFITGCPTGDTETTKNEKENSETKMNEKNSPIRKVDFKNFTFSTGEDSKDKKELTLKDGKIEKTEKSEVISLGEVKYADLTGDEKEEAIVLINQGEGDKAKINSAYVYMLEDEDPKLLMSLASSDKVMLKNIASNEGNLMVELFGDAKFEKGKWEVTVPKEKMNAEKQPTIFTKTQFKWNGKEFAVEGKPEVLDVKAETEKAEPKEKEEKKESKETESKSKDDKSEEKESESKKEESEPKTKDAESKSKSAN